MNLFRKLFGLENGVEAPSIEETLMPKPSFSLPPGLHVSQKTDVGLQRENNQDSMYTFSAYIEADGRNQSFGLFIVADGMGGYKGGEKASDIAIRTASHHILQHIYLPEVLPNLQAPQDPINEVLTAAVTKANEAVLEQAPESGTTITVAVLLDNQAYFAHVGDSRAYIYNNTALHQVSQDHSIVARMVEVGQITPEEALTHKNKNVLYRAIGQANTLEVDTYLHTIPADSYLLMCSDGLWNLVSDEVISQQLANISSIDQCVQELIDLANQNGGDDNISVILAGIGT